MTKSKSRSLLVLTLIAVAFASTVSAQRNDPLAEVVTTERAFSRMSEEQGIRESFTEFIAADGILFRPRAVLGKKWMQEHPLPAASTRPLLVWEPILAGISRAGDLGYTTGPWRYKNNIKDEKFAAFGNFMTVWKRQPDGKFKFVIDLGITNPEPKTPMKLVLAPAAPGKFRRIDPDRAREDLLNADRAFSKSSAQRGAVEAFLTYAASDVRVLRNQHQPFIGRKSGVKAMPPLTKAWTWTPEAADVAISGDLGYSYGIYDLRDKAAGLSETGNYFRVWRNIGGRWKLILEVNDPHPPEKKS